MAEPQLRVLAHLTDNVTSLLVVGDGGMPAIAYWGAALGSDDPDVALFERPVAGGGLDTDAPFGIIAEAARGWAGRPGIEGCRPDGSDGAPIVEVRSSEADRRSFRAELVDPIAHLGFTVSVSLGVGGVISIDARVTNFGDEVYRLNRLRLGLPVGAHANEVLTFGGRHNNEFGRHQTVWGRQAVVVENRRGRTSHERSPSLIVGTPGFSEQCGEVWAAHLAWSGNYELIADGVTDGRRVIQVAELLEIGEVELTTGATYAVPTLHLAYSSSGLGGVSDAFHSFIRARPSHPTGPRPIHLNTWEAVYFDHDLDRLRSLADRAAQVGVERFVLDDGWFGSRRDDTSGLGDWWVSPEAWPTGLTPLIDHVRSLGMEFGLWFEPEMVNPNSDLYREHPDWVIGDHRYDPPLGRHQLVLDLGRTDVREYLFSAIDSVLSSHDISYIKWDHNRDLVQAASGRGTGVHRQTHGVYELIDRLRAAHPGVEIESCASGGGRADLGILGRTDRVWTSDTMDPLDRHRIHRGFSVLFPPELMGAHIGAPTTHTTLRRHRDGFRAGAALFGSFGIEWDLLRLDDDGLDRVRRVVDVHRRYRDLLHHGRTVRIDRPHDGTDAHGVIAHDQATAVVLVSRLDSDATHHAAPLCVPGLRGDRMYHVSIDTDLGEPLGWSRHQPAWLTNGVRATGRHLAHAGLQLPVMHPESSLLLVIKECP